MNTTRRKIVTLFVDISGFTTLSEQLDPEKIMDLLVDDFLSNRCAPLVEEREGTVDKIDGDGLMALFGARQTHEDDPIRAIDAVFNMFEKLDEFNEEYRDELPMPIDLSAGLHRGLSVAGDVREGNQVRFTSYGDAVNTASRLEEEAPSGSIYCSESFYAQISNYCEAEAVGSVEFKGKSEPITVWNVIEKGADVEEASLLDFEKPFVGRDQEQETLKKLISQRNEELSGAIVIGKAGRGKTRLVSEAIDVCDGQSVCLKAQAYSFEKNMSYRPYLSMIENFLNCSLSSARTEINKSLYQQLPNTKGNLIDDLTHRLNQLDSYLAGHNDPQNDVERAIRLLIECVNDSQNVILRFEDLHWFDRSSLNFTSRLPTIFEDESIRYVGTMRPNTLGKNTKRTRSLEKLIQNWRTQIGNPFTTIKLTPLTFRETRKLAQNYIPNNGLPEAFLKTLHDRSSGIPFSIIHYLQKCYHLGYFNPIEGENKYRFSSSASDPGIPSSVQDLILSRLDSFGEIPRLLTETASLIRESFSLTLLSYLQPDLEMKDIQAAINQLVQNDFLEFLDQTEQLEFVHDSIPEAVSETVPVSRRKKIHQGILDYLENESDRAVSAEVKFQHAFKAEHDEKIVEYGYQLAESYWDQGWWDKSREKIETVLEHLGEKYTAEKIKALMRHHALLFHTEDISREKLFKKKQTLISRADELEDTKLQIRSRLRTLIDAQNDPSLRTQGKKHLEEAIHLAEESGRSDYLSKAYLHACYWESTKRDIDNVDFDQWEKSLEKAFEHVQNIENEERWVRLKRNESYLFERKGQLEKACEQLKEAMGQFDSTIPATLRLKITSQCLKLHRKQDRHQEALDMSEQLRTHIEDCESPGSRYYAYLQAMELYFQAGEFNKFWQWGEEASITFRDEKRGYWLKRTLTGFIDLLSRSEHPGKVNEWINWGIKAFVQIRDSNNLLRLLNHQDIADVVKGEWFEPLVSLIIESEHEARQRFIIRTTSDKILKDGSWKTFSEILEVLCHEINKPETIHLFLETVIENLEKSDQYDPSWVLENLNKKLNGISVWEEVKNRLHTGIRGKQEQGIELQTINSDCLDEVSETLRKTLDHMESGLAIPEIAEERDLAQTTIEGHVAKLFQNGVIEEDYLRKLISPWLVERVNKLRKKNDLSDELKPYKKTLPDRVSYGIIRCALALVKEGNDSS